MAGTTSSHPSSEGTAAYAAREAATAATVGPSERRDVLSTPGDRSADLAVAHAELERASQQLAERTNLVDAEKRRLEATIREYNAALIAALRVVEPAVFEEFLFFGRAGGHEPLWTKHLAASGVAHSRHTVRQRGT